MNIKQTLESIVTDTHGRLRGPMPVQVEFHDGVPCKARHAGQVYVATGKHGSHRASGRKTMEMATRQDARLWITLDGTRVWED